MGYPISFPATKFQEPMRHTPVSVPHFSATNLQLATKQESSFSFLRARAVHRTGIPLKMRAQDPLFFVFPEDGGIHSLTISWTSYLLDTLFDSRINRAAGIEAHFECSDHDWLAQVERESQDGDEALDVLLGEINLLPTLECRLICLFSLFPYRPIISSRWTL